MTRLDDALRFWLRPAVDSLMWTLHRECFRLTCLQQARLLICARRRSFEGLVHVLIRGVIAAAPMRWQEATRRPQEPVLHSTGAAVAQRRLVSLPDAGVLYLCSDVLELITGPLL